MSNMKGMEFTQYKCGSNCTVFKNSVLNHA